MRQLASTEVISSNSLDIVIKDGKFSSSWVGDIDERLETDTAKLRQKRIFVHELYAQPKANQTLINDVAINIDNWLIESLRDSFIKAENDAFINGYGKKKPKGILSEEHEKIEKFTISNEITTEKLLDFINLLDEDYMANASFLMNRVTLSAIQKLKDSTGRFIWQQSLTDSLKQTIFGIPVVCVSKISVLQKIILLWLEVILKQVIK